MPMARFPLGTLTPPVLGHLVRIQPLVLLAQAKTHPAQIHAANSMNTIIRGLLHIDFVRSRTKIQILCMKTEDLILATIGLAVVWVAAVAISRSQNRAALQWMVGREAGTTWMSTVTMTQKDLTEILCMLLGGCKRIGVQRNDIIENVINTGVMTIMKITG